MPLQSSPSAVYQSSLDRLIVFDVASDGNLYDKYYDGNEWLWEPQGRPSNTTFNPGQSVLSAVYQSKMDRVACFVQGYQLQLLLKYWNGQRWTWDDQLPGTPPSGAGIYSISAVYQPSMDRIICFCAGSDGHLYDVYWDGQEQKWQWEDQGTRGPVGVFSTPAAGYQLSSSFDRVYCFVLGADAHLYLKYWKGSQWEWDQDLGTPAQGVLGDGLSTVYQPPLDRIICFVTGNDGQLYDLYWKGPQWEWETQERPAPGVSVLGQPSAVYQSSSQRVWCFVVGDDGKLYDKHWNGQNWVWQAYEIPGARFSNLIAPSAVYQKSSSFDRVTCFAVSDDGTLYNIFWDRDHWFWRSEGTRP